MSQLTDQQIADLVAQGLADAIAVNRYRLPDGTEVQRPGVLALLQQAREWSERARLEGKPLYRPVAVRDDTL